MGSHTALGNLSGSVNVCIAEINGDSEPQQSKNYYKNFEKKEKTTQVGGKAALH